MSIKYKHEARSYGIDVKVGWHHYPDTPALTDDERNEAWYIAQRMWWDEADRLCKELGFDGCAQAGRSGGWLVPVPAVEDEEGIEALDAAIQPMLHGDVLDEYFLRAAKKVRSVILARRLAAVTAAVARACDAGASLKQVRAALERCVR